MYRSSDEDEEESSKPRVIRNTRTRYMFTVLEPPRDNTNSEVQSVSDSDVSQVKTDIIKPVSDEAIVKSEEAKKEEVGEKEVEVKEEEKEDEKEDVKEE